MNAQQLKNSILQMAVSGKLVPQDPNDEPASVLLDRIRKEKEKLIKEGKIKKEKNPSYIFRGADNTPYEKIGYSEPVSIADEVSFDIPDSWEWVRVRSCTELYNGRAFKPTDWTQDGLPIVRIQNLNDHNAPFNRYDKQVDEEVHLYGGELLFAWSGTPGTSFGAHIWDRGEAVLNQHIFKLVFNEDCLFKPYFMYALNERVGSLIKAAHGSAGLQHVTRGVFESTLIPLPPYEEQIRIVKKLAEIEPLIQQYGSAYEESQNLNSAFPEQLKKSILQIAVQGKLVPQDPDDEPASVLLERIRAEKERLIREGRIKRDKNESVIYRRDNSHYEKCGFDEKYIEEDLPFEIPETWAWARLISIIERKPQNGKSSKSVEYITSTKVLTLTATTSGTFKPDAYKYVPISVSQDSPLWLKKNDILIQRSNSREYVGTSSIYTGDDNEYIYPDLMMKIQLLPGVSAEYLDIVLKSPMVRNYYTTAASGTSESMPKINQSIVCQTLIPIPPANEQKIIVETVTNILEVVKGLDV